MQNELKIKLFSFTYKALFVIINQKYSLLGERVNSLINMPVENIRTTHGIKKIQPSHTK